MASVGEVFDCEFVSDFAFAFAFAFAFVGMLWRVMERRRRSACCRAFMRV